MWRRLLLVLLAVVAGCAAPGQHAVETTPAPIPADSYIEAAHRGAAVYRILPGQSLLLVRVGRDGPARKLGHDHAVSSENLTGFIAVGGESSESRADIAFAVRDLAVDKPGYRERLGLDTTPSEDDIAGTYKNMLKVLEPELYPWVTARARVASAGARGPQLAVSVTLHGATAEFLVPVTLATTGSTLTARGSAEIRHSDFGLVPFSAMGGLLRVADALSVEVLIVAQRVDG